MNIHHLNCMTFYQGYREITHCLLVETPDGLVLVDSGLGLADYTHPAWRVKVMTTVDRVPCDLEETAFRQVQRLGFSPRDVRHIVLTHLHYDHSGGLPDFPWAKVHVFEDEYQAAMHLRWYHILDLFGISPSHWAHNPDWVRHADGWSDWFGMPALSVIDSDDPTILLVPLPGHTPGHCGVAVKSDTGWLLHCGDAFVRSTEVDPLAPRRHFPFWFWPIERVMFPAKQQRRLRNLLRQHADEVRLVCSHDPHAFDELALKPPKQ